MAYPLKGLIVDFGGVLTTDVFESFQSFCDAEGIERDTIRARFREDPRAFELLEGLETGSLPEPDFEARFAEVLGIADHADLIDRMFAGMRADETMFAAVKTAKAAGVRTGLLANSWGKGRYDRDAFPVMFDGVVISAEVGLRKPAPRIYELAAEAVGLPPADCVFVDDLPFNLKPARELGMATVHHTDTAATVAELERLLGVPLA